MERIENRTFDEIKPGDTASLVRTLTYEDIEVFAIMSGDINPTHVDQVFAESDSFHRVVAHAMWGGALISTVLGTQLRVQEPSTSISRCISFALLARATPSP